MPTITTPNYGTGWVGPVLPNWRNATKVSGKWPWETYSSGTQNAAINTYRKGSVRVTTVDVNNVPIQGAAITINMKQHAFPWGMVYNVGMLSDHPDLLSLSLLTLNSGRPNTGPRTITAADRTAYRQKFFSGSFNGTKGESATTPGIYNGVWNTSFNRADEGRFNSLPVNKWLKNQLNWRYFGGHVLLYPQDDKFPPMGGTMAQRRAYWQANFIDQVLADNADIVTEWDLVNEIGDVSTLYPSQGGNPQYMNTDLITDLQYAQSKCKRPMYVNHWSSPTAARPHVEYFQSLGMPIQGLGYQAHLGGGTTDMNYYTGQLASMNYKSNGTTTAPWDIVITEMDSTNGSRQGQADVSIPFLRCAFANPATTSICNFGLWDPIHWLKEFYNVDAGFYDVNWNQTPLGAAWDALILTEYWTNASGVSGSNGAYDTTGFFGAYTASATVAGVTKTVKFELAPCMKEVVIVF